MKPTLDRGLRIVCFLGALSAQAAIDRQSLADRLANVKQRALEAEKSLMMALDDEKLSKQRVSRLRDLMKLQTQEKALLERRMKEIEKFLGELEKRSSSVTARLQQRQESVRVLLKDLWLSQTEKLSFDDLAQESLEAARRKMIADLVDRAVAEIEGLRADAMDAQDLDIKIGLEKEQLAAAIQDIAEREELIKANAELEKDLIRERHDERVAQLKQYKALRASEQQLEGLIRQFNARVELEEVRETEKKVHREMARGGFSLKRGELPFPLEGKILSHFGKGTDPETQLPIYRKGVEILPNGQKQTVRAIFSGKVAYAGEMPRYGRIVILDHGGHFYSLCGGLGSLQRSVGEFVRAGDPIGISDDAGKPIYFEIRDRNVAVNPLQWVSASSKISL